MVNISDILLISNPEFFVFLYGRLHNSKNVPKYFRRNLTVIILQPKGIILQNPYLRSILGG